MPAVYPINYQTACRPTSFLYKHFQHNFRRHFAFLNYKILVNEGKVPPDMSTGLSNGTFCTEYLQNYVAFVTVDGPSSAVILTERDKSFFFYDVLSTLGGHFGLFCGMSLLGIAEVIILAITALFQISKKLFCPLQTIQEIDKLEIDDKICDEKIDRMDETIKVSNSDV